MFGIFNQSLVGHPAPEISGAVWFNAEGLPAAARQRAEASEPVSVDADLAGQVLLIEFWDYDCINCINTLPQVRQWWEQYQQQSFLVIGVHTPEFEDAKDPNNVESAILQYRLTYPVVSDPEATTWERYDTKAWPRMLVVDRKGIVRHDHHGEGQYEEAAAAIEKALAI